MLASRLQNWTMKKSFKIDVLCVSLQLKKMFSPFFTPKGIHEVLHVGIFFKIAKEFERKEDHLTIGEVGQGTLMGDDEADERKVNKGHDESGEPAGDSAIGINFDVVQPTPGLI